MITSLFPGWLAGVLLSFVTAPLGAFIVWRRMSSFGDTLSHSALLAFSLSTFLDINPLWTVLIFMILLSFIAALLEHNSLLSLDIIFAIISYSALSLGMIILSLIPNINKSDINNYFFGDILYVKLHDLIFLFFIILIIIYIIIYNWKSLLSVTINSELAEIDGVNVLKNRFILIFITGITIALSIKFIGVLIITSFLVIPASISQKYSSSPEEMIIISIIISVISITVGLILSYYYDIPSSPTVVICESLIFFLSNLKKKC